MTFRVRHLFLLLLASVCVIGSLWSTAGAVDYVIKAQVRAQGVDDAGKAVRTPVAGVSVTVKNGDGDDVGTAVTDDTGAALITVPAPGDYAVILDESTLPEGTALSLNTPAETSVSADRFVTTTVTVNYFTGEAQRQTTGYWTQLAQRIADGARLGIILAMCSVGLSLIFGTTGLTNFAHGEMVTFGALMAYVFTVTYDVMPLLLAIPVAVALGGGFGLLMNGAVFSPLRRMKIGLVSQLVVSVGLSIFLKNLFLFQFGGRTKQYRDFNNQSSLNFGGVKITPRDLITTLISLVVLIIVALALQRSRLGKATRAVSDNPDLASTTGIDSQKIIRIVWFIAGSLAALGGIFRGLDEGISNSMGSDLIFLMFAGITLGGLGSAFGALVGGFVVGLFVEVSTLGIHFLPEGMPRPLSWLQSGVPNELKNVPPLVALIVILLVRPQGILGRRERVG